MRVKAHALIWIDGLLIVARPAGGGSQTELTLPGGPVSAHESIADALRRKVCEETGLEIDPGPLLYVSEVNESAQTHDLELIFLAEPSGVPTLRGHFTTVDLDGDLPANIHPPILEQIAADAGDGWRGTPRWLGATPPGSPEMHDGRSGAK